MFGLTNLGVIHTAISLVAIAAGIWAFVRYKEISEKNTLGMTYLVTTALTAATGLGIFQHGGFGPPHALSIMTLLAIAAGVYIVRSARFGRAQRYLLAVCYTTTLFFHAVPGFTETLTRLPLGKPWLPSQDAPELKTILGVVFVLYLIGLGLQLRWIHGQSRPAGSPMVEDGVGVAG